MLKASVSGKSQGWTAFWTGSAESRNRGEGSDDNILELEYVCNPYGSNVQILKSSKKELIYYTKTHTNVSEKYNYYTSLYIGGTHIVM